MIQWVFITGVAWAAAWTAPYQSRPSLSHVPPAWTAEAEAVPAGRDGRAEGLGPGLHRQDRSGGTAFEDDEETSCLEALERELGELGRKRRDLEEEIKRHRKTIQQAEKRLNRLPGYSKTVQIQRGLQHQIETNREQGKPTRSLSRLLIGVTLRLEEIMRGDEEVAAAMEGLKELSEEKRRIEGLIQQKEARAQALRNEAEGPASDEPPPLPR